MSKPLKAFISCSLRPEDEKFVNYIQKILKVHGIEPFGTVGLHKASPENPIESMKKHIPEADIVVICATPRYIQTDIKSGKVTRGLSEMVHVESGMAIALGKPVVVFVQEGTDLGSAIPNVTQYITLNGQRKDFDLKRSLILSLLESAAEMVEDIRLNKTAKVATNVVVGGLAVVGGVTLLNMIFGSNKK